MRLIVKQKTPEKTPFSKATGFGVGLLRDGMLEGQVREPIRKGRKYEIGR
jgi:hypothetical protein